MVLGDVDGMMQTVLTVQCGDQDGDSTENENREQ